VNRLEALRAQSYRVGVSGEQVRFLSALMSAGMSKTELEATLDRLPIGLYVSEVEAGTTYVNATFAEMFGLPANQCLGFGWARCIHPEDVSRLQTEIARYEREVTQTEIHYRAVHADGTNRWIHAVIQPITGEDDRHVGTIGIMRDVTRERDAHERHLQQQKLQVVGRLAGRVAHDLNNLLTILMGSASILQDALEPEAKVQRYLQMIQDAAVSGSQLTRQLLGLSRKNRPGMATTRLDRHLERLTPLLQRALGERVALELELDADGAVIKLSPSELDQTVLNLAVNARDAMEGVGKLRISTTRGPQDATLRVADDGPGMDIETVSRIFEPFFTTKRGEQGTGLGLNIIHDLVARAGGRIDTESAPGAGTTFSIRIPTVRDDAHEDELDPASVTELRGDATVLLVDDKDELRVAVGYALALHGYQVTTAGSLARARARVEEMQFDIVVCDVLLPDGTGPELRETLRALGLGTPIIYVSGYTDDAFENNPPLGPLDRFVEKPFTPKQLLREIALVLRQIGERSNERI